LGGLAALTLVVLVYAPMSGPGKDGRLLPAALASALFLVVSAASVVAWLSLAPRELRFTRALVIELRDFAVAAALAAQAFRPAAGTVAGVYGVLIRVAGAAAVQLLPPLAPQPPRDSPARRPAESKASPPGRHAPPTPSPNVLLLSRIGAATP
jgi:hypothetical protein